MAVTLHTYNTNPRIDAPRDAQSSLFSFQETRASFLWNDFY